MATKKTDYKRLAEEAAKFKKESDLAAERVLEEAVKKFFEEELEDEEDVSDEDLEKELENEMSEEEDEELDVDIEDDEEFVEEDEELDLDIEDDDEELDLDVEDDDEDIDETFSTLENKRYLKRAALSLEKANLQNAKTKAISALFTNYRMSESVYRKTLKQLDSARSKKDVIFVYNLVKENLQPNKNWQKKKTKCKQNFK